MTKFNQLILALAFLGGGTAAQASEGSSAFGGITYGTTGDKISKSKGLRNSGSGHTHSHGNDIVDRDATWGLRFGQQNEDNRYYMTYDNVSGKGDGYKLRQENLLGSYDVFLPVARSTKLFVGASAGGTKLSHESRAASRSTGMGYLVGGQFGVLQEVTQNISVELGYRYLRSNAKVEVSPHSERKLGSLKLDRSSQTYLAANYNF